MTLGQRIQSNRLKLGLSQEGLGEKLGVSRQAVSKWESDGAVPDTDKLIALSKLFHMSLNELLQVEETEKESPPPKKDWRGRLKGAVVPLLLAAVVGLGATVGVLAYRVGQLEEQMAALGALDAFAPLVADFRLDFSPLSNISSWYQIEVLPAQLSEDVEVSLQVAGGNLDAPVEPKCKEVGGRIVASGAIRDGSWNGATITAIFTVGGEGGRRYQVPLARVKSLNSFSSTVEPLWSMGSVE